jgi:hypothetical protein
MRAAGAMEKTIDTSTTRCKNKNFPKASPPPQKDSEPFKTTPGKTTNYILHQPYPASFSR